MLDVLFLLHIGKGLIFAVTLSVVVHPKPQEVFSVTNIVRGFMKNGIIYENYKKLCYVEKSPSTFW